MYLSKYIRRCDFMDNMNTSNYFVDKRDEIKESLVDLGYASGLDEKFFENVVDERS